MKYIVLFLKKTARILLKPLSFIPALLMMYLIFSMSAQNADESAGLSLKISQILVVIYNRVKELNLNEYETLNLVIRIHPYVRKAAHMTEYFLLALSVGLPLYVYRIRGIRLFILDMFICVAYAFLDEYHQTFVSGRVGDYRDVMIDAAGAFIGVITVSILCAAGKKTVFAPLSLDKYEIRR
ncbi:MAG: VanZ family protein [Lachnospiraceae bacterium]|nr:VanZ family protein [Lachnospiraceae bacterium]